MLDRDGDGARAVAAEVGGPAFEVDVRDGDAVRAAVDATVDALGGLAILVNNAGVGDLRPLHTVDERLWHRHRRREPHRHVPHDGRRDPGDARSRRRRDRQQRVACRASSPTRNEAAYSAAKAAVIALTASGALEYGPTIRVNCVAPGFIRTPLDRDLGRTSRSVRADRRRDSSRSHR